MTIAEAQDKWIRLQIEIRGFTSDSEYLRHPIHRNEGRNREVFNTRAAILEGYESGTCPKLRTVHEIMEASEYRKKAGNKGE